MGFWMNMLPKNAHSRLRKFIFLATAAVCLTAIHSIPQAYADTTYVLQLGSFDTREQAEKKWQELKSQNPNTLGKLTLHIAEISMSADDKISYRTQAGPVTSHDEAAKLCSSIQDKGGECYIIETALFTSEPSPLTNPESAAANETKSAPAVAVAQQDLAVPERTPRLLNDDEREQKPAPTPSPAANTAKEIPPVAVTATPAPEAAPTPTPAPMMEAKAEPASKSEPVKPAKKYETANLSPAELRKAKGAYIPGRQPKFLDEGTSETAAAPAVPVAPAAPVASAAPAPEAVPTLAPAPVAKPQEQKPGFFSRIFSSSHSTANAPVESNTTTNGKVVGNVNVAEAIRVPLTEENISEKPISRPLPRSTPVIEPLPQGEKIYWAQVNYFNDEESAHNFYEEFNNSYPLISDGIRMRITRPYAYANKPGHVTLRMGGFSNVDDVHNVCSLASQHNLHCVSVRDTGTAIASNNSSPQEQHAENIAQNNTPLIVNTPPAPPRFLSNTVASRPVTMASRNASGSYWVQIGTYGATYEAWDKWQEIKQSHRKIIAGTDATVTTPPASSAARKLFRLRAGPFTTQDLASSFCNKLMRTGENCLVVGE